MQRLRQNLAQNKYRLAVFTLLAGASLFCVVLFRFRVALSDSAQFAFLVWNLFLAWIPFLIAYATFITSTSRGWLLVIIPFSAFLWLIFFPNAPYILTDFQHLSNTGSEVPIWFDVILLVWFSFTGLFLGMVSLFLMQEIIRREFGRWFGWGLVALVAALASIGVYMGRFLRWNSWDLLGNPGELAQFTIYYLINPTPRSLVFFSMFAPFFLFVYLLLYTFGHLLLERNSKEL